SRVELHRHRHQPIVRAQIEKLLPVPSPARLNATADGDTHFASRSRKWLHVDFYTPGFVGLVRDPSTIGRELRVCLVELSFNDGKGFFPSVRRQRPNISLRGARVNHVENEATV